MIHLLRNSIFLEETVSQVFFRRWVQKNLSRPVEMRYNPYTQTIEVIDNMKGN